MYVERADIKTVKVTRLYLLQGIASTLFFLFLTQLGNPSTSNKRNDQFYSFNTQSIEKTEEAEISLVDDILPMILSRTGSVTQILINAMLVGSSLSINNPVSLKYFLLQAGSFLSFWFVMDLLN